MNINNPFLNNTQEDDFVFIFSQLNVTNKDQNHTKPVKRKDIHRHSLRKSHNAPHERSKRSKKGALDTQYFDFGQVIQNNAFTQGNTSNPKRKYTENPITKGSQTPCNSPKRRTSEKLTSVAKNRLPNQAQTAYFSPHYMNQN